MALARVIGAMKPAWVLALAGTLVACVAETGEETSAGLAPEDAAVRVLRARATWCPVTLLSTRALVTARSCLPIDATADQLGLVLESDPFDPLALFDWLAPDTMPGQWQY
jgi:hypothetical protein